MNFSWSVHLFELSMPSEENIEVRHKQKSDKYSHFLTDISNISLTCFEISSKGFMSTRNQKSVNNLHKFMRKDIKLQTFKKNISALAIYCSYHIWLCRSDPTFTIPPFLSPPFSDTSVQTGRRPGQ